MTLAKHWKYAETDIVAANLRGLCRSNPDLGLIPSEKVVFSVNSDTEKKVCLISGGGAGHEPLHGGYVGSNLLDAAVSGSIFASPSTKQIMAAVKTKASKGTGALIIVKNYTGDILHFGLVVERAKGLGYNVEMLAVTDDVAVGRKQNEMVGRRGLAGTAIIHKVLGAAASIGGAALSELHQLGVDVNSSLVTLGASLDRTSVPGKASEELEFTGPDEAELGLGIHNEPGIKLSPIPDIDELVKDMFHKLVSPDDKDRHYVDFDLENDNYVLLINNIGGTSSLELYTITEHVVKNLPLKKKPKRVLVSDFVTSLNSPGFSITLLNLTKISKQNQQFGEDDILTFIDAPTNAVGWKPKHFDAESWNKDTLIVDSPNEKESEITSSLTIDGEQLAESLKRALAHLIEEEPKITHYDTVVGDGDCGETLVAGANGILDAFKNKKFQDTLSDPVATVTKITEIVEDTMGGTSGGLYSIFLTAFGHQLQKASKCDVKNVSKALHDALYEGLFKYTKARVGGRTLVDTLQPFVDTLKDTEDLQKALEAAKYGCERTKKLHAKFGRASYVDDSELKAEGGIPDPGAVGLLALLEGFLA